MSDYTVLPSKTYANAEEEAEAFRKLLAKQEKSPAETRKAEMEDYFRKVLAENRRTR